MNDSSEVSVRGQVTLQNFEEESQPQQVGEFDLTLPRVLRPELKELMQNLHAAVKNSWGKDALDAAVTELSLPQGHLRSSAALELFAHLICLQNLGVLPGYPRYSQTIEDSSTPIPVKDYCSAHSAFEGTVTTTDLARSDYITRHRLYRSKIYSVTDRFWTDSHFVDGTSPWSWKTYSSYYFDVANKITTHEVESETYFQDYKDNEFLTTTIFDDGGGHNVAVKEVRDWISTHPKVESTKVPYVTNAPEGVVEIDGRAPIDPQRDPYWMFDLGVLANGNVALLGNIIADDPATEILDQINRSFEVASGALIVMSSRKAVHQFLAQGAANDCFDNKIVPDGEDVIEYYKRQPSLSHVNREIWRQYPSLERLVFLTRKQILDGFVHPTDIIPSSHFNTG